MMSTVLQHLALCLTIVAYPLQLASKPSPRESVETAVIEAIRLIETKNYQTFLLQFATPDLVKDKTGSPAALKDWVDVFQTHSVGNLLKRLKEARGLTPTYDNARTTAVFQLKEYDGTSKFRMVKIGQYWYIPADQ